MLLDSQLVEKFHGMHRQKLSGCLVADGDGFHLGICLLEGEPVAVDIGRDLQAAFADACRTYHKIDADTHAEAVAAMAGGGKVRDYLVERQLISEAEAEQISQAVIEDHLLRCFRGPCTNVAVEPGRAPDSLDYVRSAVRMRIGVEPLIRTLDQRLAEEQLVEREVGPLTGVFSLSEAEHSSGQLSEYEKMVLNFVDGKLSIEQTAELCRDSSLNLARVVRSLLAKKVIQRVYQSGLRPALTGAAAGSPIKPTAAAEPEFVVMRTEKPPTRHRAVVLAGLIALLVLCIGVVLLVMQYNRKQERLRHDEDEVAAHIAASRWGDARETVIRLRTEAGSDLSAVRRVEGLAGRVEQAVETERAAIGKLIDASDFAGARKRLAHLPEETVLAQRLRDTEERFRRDSEATARDVRGRLVSGDIVGALVALDAAPPRISTAAEAEIERWRTSTMEEARSPGQPIQKRLATIARLKQARPTPAQETQILQLETDLQTQVRQLLDQLDQLDARAAAGAHVEVIAELARLRITDSAAGTEIEPRAARVAETCKRVSAAITAVVDPAMATLSRGETGDILLTRRAEVERLLGAYGAISGKPFFDHLVHILGACASSQTRTVAARAAEALELAKPVAEDAPAIAKAMQERAKNLSAIEDAARLALEDARRLGRIGDWAGAVQSLESLVSQPSWNLTEVRREAELELEQARAKAARRIQLQEQLRAALVKGDVDACTAIAREVGLAYLPLALTSAPLGAEVLREGKVVGTTPLILDVNADQRVELELVLRLPGYEPMTVKGAQAEAGWKLVVRLDRHPESKLDLGHPLTARPAILGDALWLADRGRIVRIAAPGAAPQILPIEATAPLSEPVFAPVADDGHGPLLVTRERVALRIGASGLIRVALPVGSDQPMLGYVSPIVIDRELSLVAGSDGRLHAADSKRGSELWQGPPGAAFAGPIVLSGDQVLCVRRDGRLERIHAEDGELELSADVGRPLLGSWVVAGKQVCLSELECCTWDGLQNIQRDPLPEPCVAGAPGIVVSGTGRVLVRGPEAWTEAGKLIERPAAGAAIFAAVWNGQAVVAAGPQLTVLGPAPFSLRGKADLLPPVIWGKRLVVASLAGEVWIFAP